MACRILKNDLTNTLLNEIYDKDFKSRTDKESLIGQLREYTPGIFECFEDLVYESLSIHKTTKSENDNETY